MPTKNEICSFLKALRAYDPIADLLLRKGEWFHGRINSEDHAVTREWRKWRKPRSKDCYYNSHRFCLDCSGYRYFEGYMAVCASPSEHAWVVNEAGQVIDFTLEALLRKVKREKIPVTLTDPLYVGIEIPRTFLAHWALENGCGEPLADVFFAESQKGDGRTKRTSRE